MSRLSYIQYQKLAEPVGASFRPNAVNLYMAWAPVLPVVMVQECIFLYQAKAEPLEPSVWLSMATWYVEQPTQPPAKPRTPWFQAFTEPLSPNLRVVPDMETWYIEQPAKPPEKPRAAWFQLHFEPLEPSLFVIPSMTTWYVEQPTKPPERPRASFFDFYTKTVEPSLYVEPLMDTWYVQQPTKPPGKPRAADFPHSQTHLGSLGIVALQVNYTIVVGSDSSATNVTGAIGLASVLVVGADSRAANVSGSSGTASAVSGAESVSYVITSRDSTGPGS